MQGLQLASSLAAASLEMYVYYYGPLVTDHNLIFTTNVRIGKLLIPSCFANTYYLSLTNIPILIHHSVYRCGALSLTIKLVKGPLLVSSSQNPF